MNRYIPAPDSPPPLSAHNAYTTWPGGVDPTAALYNTDNQKGGRKRSTRRGRAHRRTAHRRTARRRTAHRRTAHRRNTRRHRNTRNSRR